MKKVLLTTVIAVILLMGCKKEEPIRPVLEYHKILEFNSEYDILYDAVFIIRKPDYLRNDTIPLNIRVGNFVKIDTLFNLELLVIVDIDNNYSILDLELGNDCDLRYNNIQTNSVFKVTSDCKDLMLQRCEFD